MVESDCDAITKRYPFTYTWSLLRRGLSRFTLENSWKILWSVSKRWKAEKNGSIRKSVFENGKENNTWNTKWESIENAQAKKCFLLSVVSFLPFYWHLKFLTLFFFIFFFWEFCIFPYFFFATMSLSRMLQPNLNTN